MIQLPWTCTSHLRPATKWTRHSVFQCCQKGLDSKQLRQDVIYIQIVTKLLYKNNISSDSYKNNATRHHLMSSSCAQAGCMGRWPDLPSRKINPNQSSTAGVLYKEGFHSKFITAINLSASCTCKGRDESLAPLSQVNKMHK